MLISKETYRICDFPGGPNCLFLKKPREFEIFEGVQLLISIETYRICDFPGDPQSPPLGLRRLNLASPGMLIRMTDFLMMRQKKIQNFLLSTLSSAYVLR